MALDNGTLSAADVAAVTNGNGVFGNDGSFWIIVLFLFALMGGWGNGYGGGMNTAVPYIQKGQENLDLFLSDLGKNAYKDIPLAKNSHRIYHNPKVCHSYSHRNCSSDRVQYYL